MADTSETRPPGPIKPAKPGPQSPDMNIVAESVNTTGIEPALKRADERASIPGCGFDPENEICTEGCKVYGTSGDPELTIDCKKLNNQ